MSESLPYFDYSDKDVEALTSSAGTGSPISGMVIDEMYPEQNQTHFKQTKQWAKENGRYILVSSTFGLAAITLLITSAGWALRQYRNRQDVDVIDPNVEAE